MSSIERINNLLNNISITPENEEEIKGAKMAIENGDYVTALNIIKSLNKKKTYKSAKNKNKVDNDDDKKRQANHEEEQDEQIDKTKDLSMLLPLSDEDDEEFDGAIYDNGDDYYDEEDEDIENEVNSNQEQEENVYSEEFEEDGDTKESEESIENREYETNENNLNNEFYEEPDSEGDIEYTFETDKDRAKYPLELRNIKLEKQYIGLLLSEPKYIVRYYILFDECYFESEALLNIYKSILFTEGGDYTPEIAKQKFNFSREVEGIYQQKYQLKKSVKGKNYNMEKIYTDLKKLCLLRKSYTEIPIETIQEKIVEIANYELYDKMTVEEVKNATNQVMVTDKFKQSVLNIKLTDFLEAGESNLSNGLSLPFPILTQVFKGIRKGETMAVAMPSNAGKSRFTMNLAAYTSLIHKKKVLIISNEMSEEKMRLNLITTILNHPEIQKLHGQKLHITEGELLEFKFRPDDPKKVKVDESGYVIQNEKETRKQFVERLLTVSSDFKNTITVTDWINKQVFNSIYFINITDHTNDELQKVIMNYYYKEQIEYVFYDTLKTDTANIGNGEELKRTATILSNLAQNFGIFICSTLQLTENKTNPINLDINDLAVSRTVKEVLDTLCLMKQIPRKMYDDFQYSENEVDTKFFDLKKYKDPDERYYACVVDKNRAGAKPKLLFGLNLAYNRWEELGYLSLKNIKED